MRSAALPLEPGDAELTTRIGLDGDHCAHAGEVVIAPARKPIASLRASELACMNLPPSGRGDGHRWGCRHPATMSASRAIAPCPRAYTMTGLRSISRISGRA